MILEDLLSTMQLLSTFMIYNIVRLILVNSIIHIYNKHNILLNDILLVNSFYYCWNFEIDKKDLFLNNFLIIYSKSTIYIIRASDKF
jgi:hypothetical protein